MGYAALELTGMKFGRLTALNKHGQLPNGGYLWRCACECGNEKIVYGGSLVSGYTKSCGCISKERPSHTIHGGKGTPIYLLWKSMRERCNTTSSSSYRDYGGRGIKICSEWDDYRRFKEWAETSGYKSGLSIERKNVNGNYEPSNCTWIPVGKQARNTRRTLRVLYNGMFIPLIEYAEISNQNYGTLHSRYRRGALNMETRVGGVA